MDTAVMSARMQKWAGIIQEAATCGMTKREQIEDSFVIIVDKV